MSISLTPESMLLLFVAALFAGAGWTLGCFLMGVLINGLRHRDQNPPKAA